MRIFALLTVALAALNTARADDWHAPQVREGFSTSRDHFVRITPGTSWGDTIGFAGAAKGAYATAEFFTRNIDAVSPYCAHNDAQSRRAGRVLRRE